MSDHREAIAEVLAAHEDYTITSNWDAAICRCGVKVCDLNDNATDADTPYRAHLADALLGSDVLAQIRAEARAEAWDGAGDDIGPDNAVPTPAQLLRRMADATADERLAWAERAIVNSEKAHDCFLQNHRARIACLERRVTEAKAEALREAADSYLDCLCGHEIEWHHEERGCQYLGNGPRRCRCLRDAHTAVGDRLRARAGGAA